MDQQDGNLRSMILAFRVTELQTLLTYAGKNRSGRKNELQDRAMELLRKPQGGVISKIRELYKSIQLSNISQQPPASTGIVNPSTGGHTIMNRQPYSNTIQLNAGASILNGSSSSTLRSGFIGSGGGYAGAAEKVLLGRNPYMSSVGNGKIPGLQTLAMQTTPICPDVTMKKLPFYDILHVLHKPASLISHTPNSRGIQDSVFQFYFTPSQASDISSSKEYNYDNPTDSKIQYTTQVQLRFCALDKSIDQDDLFPPSMIVKINGKLIPLPHPIPSNRPGVEPKRPSRPLNVTNYCKLSPTVSNNMVVSWSNDSTGRSFCMTLLMVKKLCSKDLLGRLKGKGPRPADFTRGMIKEICMKDDTDCCIATTTLTVSLACPLGKSRMALPCRASTCSHLQCFDAALFIQMNEKKPIWTCPVCDKPTLFENLAIDGYFDEIIKKVKLDEGNDIEILPDTTWAVVKKEKDEPPAKKARTVGPTSSVANTTICIDDDIIIEDDDDDDDDDDEEDGPQLSHTKQSPEEAAPVEAAKDPGPVQIVDLTLSSDEDEGPPLVIPRQTLSVPTPTQPPPSPPPQQLPKVIEKPKEMEPQRARSADPVREREPPPHRPYLKEKPRDPSFELPTKERQTHQQHRTTKSKTSLEDGEVSKESSDDDEEDNIRPVRRQPSRKARPVLFNDESSEEDDGSEDSSASTRAPDSPQCIDIDSSSDSDFETERATRRNKSTKSSSSSRHGGGGSNSNYRSGTTGGGGSHSSSSSTRVAAAAAGNTSSTTHRAGTSGSTTNNSSSNYQNNNASTGGSGLGAYNSGSSGGGGASASSSQPVQNYTTNLQYQPLPSGSSLPNPRYNSAGADSSYMNSALGGGSSYQAPNMSSYRTNLAVPPAPIIRTSPNNLIDHGMNYPSAGVMGSYMAGYGQGGNGGPGGWGDSSGAFSVSDFTALEYPSMEYFNGRQPAPYGNPRPGAHNNYAPGYGSPW